MTPKEKAIELYEKFFYTIPSISDEGQLEHETSKQCSVIAVDEIIKAIDFDWMQVQNLESEHRYWEEVKTEIEKL